jgi:hypothetical protein
MEAKKELCGSSPVFRVTMEMTAWNEGRNTEARQVMNLRIRKWFTKTSTLNKYASVCNLYNQSSYTSCT